MALGTIPRAPDIAAASPARTTSTLPRERGCVIPGAEEAQTLAVIEALQNKASGTHGTPIHFVIEDEHLSPKVAVQINERRDQ